MIDPVSLPSAAGIDFGEGDVRHFSQGDAVDVPGLSSPTRHLANRDSILAEKLNDVIGEVNNKEQIVSLPVFRMVLTPSTEEIVVNHRIPPGYEARVLNAAVSSTPVSSAVELDILWSVGFGNVTGTSVLTTTNEAQGGTKFSPEGEFIVVIKNKGDITLDVLASIALTVRPVTKISTALLPAPTVQKPGPVGPKGDQGNKGDTGGAGPAGSPGVVWRRAWTTSLAYSVSDAVSYPLYGTLVSTFIAQQNHTSQAGVNDPAFSYLNGLPFWDVMALGSAGPSGNSGSAGASLVNFNEQLLNGTIATGANYVPGTQENGYKARTANTTLKAFLFNESIIYVTGTSSGMSAIQGQLNEAFAGDLTLRLPTKATDGAFTDWTNDWCAIIATANGTDSSGVVKSPRVYTSKVSVDQFMVSVPGTIPMQVSALFIGQKTS